ncbi:MAG: hypothetical protein MZV65_53725 [Chromatiales bacterium]|nr:hypothetical protein [Chromatiales bacterium]
MNARRALRRLTPSAPWWLIALGLAAAARHCASPRCPPGSLAGQLRTRRPRRRGIDRLGLERTRTGLAVARRPAGRSALDARTVASCCVAASRPTLRLSRPDGDRRATRASVSLDGDAAPHGRAGRPAGRSALPRCRSACRATGAAGSAAQFEEIDACARLAQRAARHARTWTD